MSQAQKSAGKPSLLVVVWEWKNKQGRWRPYSPEVTQQLERAYGKNLRSVFLGDADPSLKDYCVVLSAMQQKCNTTGTVVKVRRNLYPQSSAAGQGAVWQWAADMAGDWRIYDMVVQCALEDSWTSGAQTLELSEVIPGCPYVIYFCNLSQKNKKTGFIRSIRRKTQAAYPIGRPVTPHQYNQSTNVHTLLTQPVACSQPQAIPDKGKNRDDFELKAKIEPTGARGLINKVFNLAGSSGTNGKNSTPQTSMTSKGASQVFGGRRPPKPLPRYTSATPIVKPRTRFNTAPKMLTNVEDRFPPETYQEKEVASSYHLLGSSTTLDSDCSSSQAGGPRRPSIETISTYLSQESFNDDNSSVLSYGEKTDTLIHFDDSLSDDDVFLVDREVSDVMSRAVSHDAAARQMQNSGTPYSMQSRFVPITNSEATTECGTKRKRPFQAMDSIDPGTSKQIPKICPTRPAESEIEKLLLQNCRCVAEPPNDICSICLERLSDSSGFDDASINNYIISLSVSLKLCQHIFHEVCLLHAIGSSGNSNHYLQCPNCKQLHGEKWGTQPTKGYMKTEVLSASLPGHYDCGTIRIIYIIKPGIQGPEHPHPGRSYHPIGFPRICYLPNNQMGNKVLHLLREAFRRRLTFTVGPSVTTGRQDVVTWNEIHHKTEWKNRTGHGYPDPNYMDNVLQELAQQGVTEESLV